LISKVRRIAKQAIYEVKFLRHMYVKYLVWYPDTWNFDVVEAYSKYKSKIKFIQVGSNDGITNDPIYQYIKKYRWEGVLVEPVPYLFHKLKDNYRNINANVRFENCAIAHVKGRLKFYRLKENSLPNLPAWYDQLGSFDKEVILKHRSVIPFFDELLVEDIVDTITFEDLLSKYNIAEVNLIHIDTEGYDYEILKMLRLETLVVDLIMFEHKHLTAQDYRSGLDLLRKSGFSVGLKDSSDTIAIRTVILKNLKKSRRFWYP
jgi:FkbM family methyltransferase